MAAMIIEILQNEAIVLTQNADFIKINAGGEWKVGDIVMINSDFYKGNLSFSKNNT